ncbi:MAG: nucleotide exchange factor GrpE [Hyphomicrobium sp.]|jgi:molecular chaperone GrpE
MADDIDKPDESAKPAGTGPDPAPEAAPGVAADATTGETARLEAEVEKLDGQIADLTDRLLRAHADIENLRRRMEREKEETAKYAISKFARDVVNVADNFERAVQAVPAGAAEQDNALKSLVEGVTMTEREFLKVLERHGVRRVNPKGEFFNPHQHQAVMEVQNADVPSGTIMEVFQPGYIIDDRVLRPAMVVVAKGGQKQPKPGAEAGNGTPPPPDNGDGSSNAA